VSQSILRRLIIVAAVLVVVVQAIFPMKQQIRYGKDLAGGATLTYRVQHSASDPDKKGTLMRVIDVIRQRIDPQGQLDITIVPQGEDRLEITMPLPSDDVKALRKKVDDAIASVGDANFTQDAVLATLRLPGAERGTRIQALAGTDKVRQEKLETAAAAMDKAAATRQALDQTAQDATNRDELVSAAAEAELARDAAVDAVLQTAVSPEEMRRVLLLPDNTRVLSDGPGKPTLTVPSARQVAIDAIKAQHPGAKDKVDEVVKLYSEYAKARKTLDDPQDLIRMLRGAGVLTFRITVPQGVHPEEARLRRELQENGPKNARANDARWFKINDISTWYSKTAEYTFLKENPSGFFANRGGYVVEERLGDYYMLCYDTPATTFKTSQNEGVESARATTDQLGQNAIAFSMNTLGATRLGALTGAHVGQQMAVLLDDQVYTAPNLRSAISSSGEITGTFSKSEVEYIVRVLAAGSLQAKLGDAPIGQSVVGPEFGVDNLRKGLYAGAISFVVCAGFLALYYFTCGTIAVFGLSLNVVMIVGVMALNHAAFTLPGIAGVILTFAMAVDANVLVYERMREEFVRGIDLKEAIRLGYQRAMPAVVDGNLTNLIVCAVLATFGTPEIKGFGITMSIGVLTTLFSQLFVTRLVFDVLTGRMGWRKTSMLPLAVPAVQRALTLNVKWMNYRGLFYTLFAGLVAVAVFMITTRGSKMLDTEFVGGTEVVVQLKRDASGNPLVLTRAEVADRLAKQSEKGTSETNRVHQLLRTADIVVVDPRADGVTSDRFRVRVQNEEGTDDTNTAVLASAIRESFQDVINTPVGLTFRGSSDARGEAIIFPILTPTLGESINRGDAKMSTADDLGGAAIILQDLQPQTSLDDLNERLEEMRGNSAFNDIASHERRLVLIEGTPSHVRTVAIIVVSPDVSYLTDPTSWATQMRGREWELVRSTLTDPAPDLTLRSFDASVAASFAEKAITSIVISLVLIVIYVWVRFGSFRFSIAAIVPTMIDSMIALGLIALAEMICEANPKVGATIGLMPFKVDLTVVAALLTILGYSINDKIVVLDRIRENKGKLAYVSRAMVDQSINQVMSRTIMTGSTTIISTFVLYLVGGEGVRAFAYSLGLGVIIGTISSVALGAPIAWSKKGDQSQPEDGAAA